MATQDLGPVTSRPKDVVTYDVLTARVPKITVGTVAPTSPAVGDVWIDTN